MNIKGQLQALREYVATLQRQNEAKGVERETLYRQLEALQSELKQMDRVFSMNKQLKEQIKNLSNTIYSQENQISQMKEVCLQFQKYKNQAISLSLEKTKNDEQIGCLHKNYRDLIEENERMFKEIQKLEIQINNEKKINEKGTLQIKKLRSQMQKAEKEKSKQAALKKQKEIYEFKLEELATNYIKLQSILIEKQKENAQLNYQMSQALRQLQKQGQEVQFLKASLGQKEIMIDCLQSQLQQLKITYRKTEESSDSEDNISKLDLIKQANLLVERVNFLEKENRGDNDMPLQNSKTLIYLQELKMQYSNLLQNLAL